MASWKADKFYRPPKENLSLFKAVQVFAFFSFF